MDGPVDHRPPWLERIDLDTMRGLEIGALHAPRLDKATAEVRYVDHATTEELRAKYATDAGMAGHLDELVDVDVVWDPAGSLSEAVGDDGAYDYVLASHVIEHVPDPVGWLAQLADVLRPGGAVSLIVPDGRYCFDVHRDLTEVSDLIEAHFRCLTAPTYRQIFDFFTKIVSVDEQAIWRGEPPPGVPLGEEGIEREQLAIQRCREQRRPGAYVDVHCHVFTPTSFLEILRSLSRLDLVDYRLAWFAPTAPGTIEFYVTLERLGPSDTPDLRRKAQLDAIAGCTADVCAGDHRDRTMPSDRSDPPNPDRLARFPSAHRLRPIDLSEREESMVLTKRALLGFARHRVIGPVRRTLAQRLRAQEPAGDCRR